MELFREHADITYTFIVSLFFAKTFYLILGFIGLRYISYVVRVPSGILSPVILVLSVVGSYAIRNSVSDVWLMLAMGLLGYGLRKYNFPLAPICLAIILGPLAESNLARALTMADNNLLLIFKYFVSHAICLILLILIIASLMSPLIKEWILRKSRGSVS